MNSNTRGHAALEALCRRYWYPLYTFVRRQGRPHHEAEDCVQEFITQLLARDGLQRAHPDRGRFRTFLLAGLSNFLTSDWRRSHAAKRGGGFASLPLTTPGFDTPSVQEPKDAGLNPEQAFDHAWALSMIDRAIAELRQDYETSGRAKIFAALSPLLWATENSELLAQHAAEAGLNVNAFTVALHRSRRRLGDRLRAMVAETVSSPEEIDAELRHLIDAINGTTGRA
jgi:RNA polymerase sigma-70 factor (ECF subfamily)